MTLAIRNKIYKKMMAKRIVSKRMGFKKMISKKDKDNRDASNLCLVQQVKETCSQIHDDALVGERAGHTVEGGRVANGLALGAFALDDAHALLFALLLDDRLEVADELGPDLCDGQGDGDVDGGRVLQRVEVPALGGHGVGNVVDVEVLRGKGHDGDERAADNLELARQRGRLADGVGNLLGGADNLGARVDVAGLAHGHEARPAAGDEGAGAGAREARRGVDAAGPVRAHVVLVGAEGGGAVEDRRVALGREAVLVRVAR